ncbi:MAG: cysteine peptidase family C39 domain-containing protein [Leptolyngbyaceae cyanobacterium bins.59]|nr:cysteine peptidase family C39 domain-containing protein [Leptolyngbyaceae cyanobacterium bins.59]
MTNHLFSIPFDGLITLEIGATLLLGSILFWAGMRLGHVLLRQGATAQDLFKGHHGLAFLFLGLYVFLIVISLNIPQLPILPIEWRFYGMRVSLTLMRILLIGIAGVAFTISWKTARSQVIAVLLIGLLGVGGFSAAEVYFLAPIHAELDNNLRPNGVFRQTSSSSCAPAALATLLRRWGLDATESEVARLAGTSRLGTSMPQLIIAARSLGFDGLELKPTWEQMQQINRPGILAVWLLAGVHRLPHAVTLLALDQERATIADPANGRIYRLNRQQFARVWRQEYVPIFRPNDLDLNDAEVVNYLDRSGFKSQPGEKVSSPLRSFQERQGLPATGNLDGKTALLLRGSFLQSGPTLSSHSL